MLPIPWLSQIAIGYGHAPRTYFLWAQLICYNGDTDLLPSGSVHCEDQYLVRYAACLLVFKTATRLRGRSFLSHQHARTVQDVRKLEDRRFGR